MTTAIDELIKTLLNGLKGIFQLHIAEGKKGQGKVIASYFVQLSQTKIMYQKGIHDAPDLAITVNQDDFILLATGKLSPVTAFMSGSVHVKGNLQLAMKAFSVSEAARKLARQQAAKL